MHLRKYKWLKRGINNTTPYFDASAVQGLSRPTVIVLYPKCAFFHDATRYQFSVKTAPIPPVRSLETDSKASKPRLKAVHLTQIGAACMGPNVSTRGSTPPKAIADAVAMAGARWVPGLRALSPFCRPKPVQPGGKALSLSPLVQHANTTGKSRAYGSSTSKRHSALVAATAASNASPSSAHSREFTFCELFAGIGGFRVGMEQIGGRCVFASEIDREARYAYTVPFLSRAITMS